MSAPAATLVGGITDAAVTPDVNGMVAALEKLGSKLAGGNKTASLIVVHGAEDSARFSKDALLRLVEEGYTDVIEMEEGMGGREGGWLKYYTPGGKPRPRYVGYGKDNEETYWTASN